MKKIKDFIYDYNDVLVALLIVAAAGIIIFWRVNAVMDYASYVANEPVKNIDVNFEGIDLKPVDTEDQKDAEVEPERPDDPAPVDPTPVDPTPVDPTPTDPTPVDPTPITPETPTVKTYKLVVSKESGIKNFTTVGKKLQEKGIIDDYLKLVDKAMQRGVEKNLQQGEFNLNSDMTIDQIIDILIGKK